MEYYEKYIFRDGESKSRVERCVEYFYRGKGELDDGSRYGHGNHCSPSAIDAVPGTYSRIP